MLESFKIIYNICFVIFFSCTRRINLYIMQLRRDKRSCIPHIDSRKFPPVMLISEKNPLDLRNYVWVVYIKQRFDSQRHMLRKTMEQKIVKIMEKNTQRIDRFGWLSIFSLVYKFLLVNKLRMLHQMANGCGSSIL